MSVIGQPTNRRTTPGRYGIAASGPVKKCECAVSSPERLMHDAGRRLAWVFMTKMDAQWRPLHRKPLVAARRLHLDGDLSAWRGGLLEPLRLQFESKGPRLPSSPRRLFVSMRYRFTVPPGGLPLQATAPPGGRASPFTPRPRLMMKQMLVASSRTEAYSARFQCDVIIRSTQCDDSPLVGCDLTVSFIEIKASLTLIEGDRKRTRRVADAPFA